MDFDFYKKMRRFFVSSENFQEGKVFLSLEETRHLRDVLRLRVKEKIRVFDGEGQEFLCVLEEIGKKSSTAEVLEKVASPSPESQLELVLAVALLKGEKFDLVVQKATELGVSKIVPLLTKRVEVKISDAGKKKERWEKIVLEASKQCGRARLLRISEPVNFEEFATNSKEKGVMFAERGGVGFREIKTTSKLTAVVGAEGGWEESEISLAREKGFQIITLGGRILRAETAGIVVASLLQNHFGDLN